MNPTAPSYERVLESDLFSRKEREKSFKHLLAGASMVPLVMSTCGKLGPSAEAYLQSLAAVASSSGIVDRGVWLRVARQYLSCALVRGRGFVVHRYYSSLAKGAGKDFRAGAAVAYV